MRLTPKGFRRFKSSRLRVINNLGDSRQRADIQALRGLSVMAVVLFHTKKDLFPNGYLGVDAFFVISGYLIIRKILKIELISKSGNKKEAWRQLRIFIIKRYLRLFPALNVVLGLTVLLTFLFASPFEFRRIITQALGGYFSIANFTALNTTQNYFIGAPNPHLHLWSTSVEVQIYAICSVLLCVSLLQKKTHKKDLTFYLYIVGITSIFLFVTVFVTKINLDILFNVGENKDFFFYNPIFRLWEIVLPGVFYIKYKSKFHDFWLTKKICFITIAFMLLVPIKLPFSLSVLAVVFISTSYLNLPTSQTSFLNVFWKTLIWLGDRAYSIFLIHMPLFYFTRYSPLIETSNKTLPMLISLVLLLPLASLLYYKIEIKYLSYNLVRKHQKKIFSSSVYVFLVLICSFGLISINLNGGGLVQMLGTNNETKAQTDWDLKCKLEYKRESPCEYIVNSEVDKKLFVVGDSTGAISTNYVATIAGKYNWNLYAWNVSACPFFVPTEAVKKARDSKDRLNESQRICIEQNKKRWIWVQTNKPSVLIIQFRTTEYYLYLFQKDIKAEISKSIHLASKLVDQVILVLPNPEFSPFVLNQISKIQKIEELPSGPFEDQDFFVKYNFDSNVFLVDSIKNLCTQNLCNMFDNGKILYSDLFHLNIIGSTKNLAEFENLLRLRG